LKRTWLVLLAAVAACSPAADRRADAASDVNAIVVRGSDYAFTMPDSVPAGLTTFLFTSTGKVRHELNISRLKPDVSMDSLLATVRADESVKDLIEGPVGVLFAEPGDSSSAGLTVDLKPGERYAVICIFADSAGAKRHFDLGMYKQVTVTGTSSATQQLAADTIIATDYAFQYPRELPPGRRTFVMRNDGKQRHQFGIELLRKGVTVDSVMKVAKAGGDVFALMEGAYGLLHARAGTQHIGGLTMELLPEREYLITCYFRDTPQSPEHVDLGMFGVIRTTAEGATGD
jgi:hypothetical protein